MATGRDTSIAFEPTAALRSAARAETRHPRRFESAQTALKVLYDAHQYAADLAREPWDFAVGLYDLQAIDPAIVSALRWLVCKGYVVHGRETTNPRSVQRTFQQTAGLKFSPQTCFVLSPGGVVYAEQLFAEPLLSMRRGEPAPRNVAALQHLPVWDGARRELRLGVHLIKRFKVPAINQELILRAFQEESWPARIDDPLPPQIEIDPKRRLHDAVTSLNRNRKSPILRFRGDGSGKGICWDRLDGHGDGASEAGS